MRSLSDSIRFFARSLLVASASAAALLPAHAADDIVIGQVVPLTGVISGTGIEFSSGVAAYMAAANEAGGVNGRPLRVILKDDSYKPETTLQHTLEILDKHKPVALLGYIGTANVSLLLKNKVLSDNRIALLGPYTGAEELRTPFNPYIFHLRASYSDETAKMVQHLYTLGVRRIAVFYQGDGFGKNGLIGAEAAMAKVNLKPVATASYDRTKPEDISAAANTIIAADPEAVITISVNKASAALIKRLHAAKSRAHLFSISVVNFKELLKNTGGELARGVGIAQVMPYPYNLSSPVSVVREFHAAMKKHASGKVISYASMEGFIAAKVMVEAIRRAGAKPTREKVLASLENMREYDAGGFKVNFSPKNRVGSRFVEVTVIGAEGRLLR